MVKPSVRGEVRQRANLACEFCGTTEEDTGGELTIDHFWPTGKGGDDSLDNLLYSCARCNQYKLDYWPERPDDPSLWNPRREPASQHFIELDDGTLHPLTATGAFTLRRLRLNRPPLVAHRVRKRQEAEIAHLLAHLRELVGVTQQLLVQQAALTEEQHALLEEQQRLLQLLLGGQEMVD